MIHAQLTDGDTVQREQDFATFDEFCKANELAVIHADQNLYWQSPQVGHCECCNEPYERPGIIQDGRGFCSDDCAQESQELAGVLAGHDLDHGPPDSDPYDIERPSW